MSDNAVNRSRREFLGTTALVLSSAMIGVPAVANAAETKINGFTPVYRGAITQNEPGKVNIHRSRTSSMAWTSPPMSIPRRTTIRRRSIPRLSWRIRMAA